MSARLWKIVKYVVLLLITVINVYPFLLMVLMATHTTEEIFQGVSIIPGNHFPANLGLVMRDSFFTAYGNSLLVSVASTVFCVLFSSMAGYSLVAYTFKLKNLIYNFVLITMMIPGQITIIGYMMEMRTAGFSRTLLPLIFVWFANGFAVFWMTQYMKGSFRIELVESARIDGSGELRTFFSIVLPCIKPALVIICMMIFLWSWNQYLLPVIIVNDASNYTIPLFIQTLGSAFRTDYAARITGLLLATIPLVAAFGICSKTFIRGLTAGAIKG